MLTNYNVITVVGDTDNVKYDDVISAYSDEEAQGAAARMTITRFVNFRVGGDWSKFGGSITKWVLVGYGISDGVSQMIDTRLHKIKE